MIVSPVTVTDEVLAELRKDGLPFVQIDRSIKGEDVPCVRTDHGAGSALAVDHLVKRGHKEIAYVGGPLEIQTYELRLEGFDAASKIKVIKEIRTFTDLGLKEAKELVEKAPAVIKGGLSKEEAQAIVERMKAIGAKVVMD
jgi:ribosomal protein L7/L12